VLHDLYFRVLLVEEEVAKVGSRREVQDIKNFHVLGVVLEEENQVVIFEVIEL
jgi:hypothetical protein